MIRAATEADIALIQRIEIEAGARFREIGMESVADDPPATDSELRPFVADGRAWMSGQAGYLLVDVVDAMAHIEQVSVRPAHARQGIGARLIDHAADWALGRGLPGICLTTYTDVPWNGPYYRRLGFEYVHAGDLGPGLRAIRSGEAARGLDRWPRAAMVRPVPGRTSGSDGVSRRAYRDST